MKHLRIWNTQESFDDSVDVILAVWGCDRGANAGKYVEIELLDQRGSHFSAGYLATFTCHSDREKISFFYRVYPNENVVAISNNLRIKSYKVRSQ